MVMGIASLAPASEFLWPQQGVGQVDEERRGHDAGEPIIEDHGCLLEPVAGVDVGDRPREEAETKCNQDEVQHSDVSLRMCANG